MKTFIKPLLILPVILTLVACKAGNGEGLNAQGRPDSETPVVVPPDTTPNDPPAEDPNKISANLSSIQDHVFTPICAVVCHGGANPAAGQDLSTIENSIANLINVQSSNPLFKRVLSGSPEQSYLYLKVTGNAQAGARMPLGQPALPDDAINAIKDWIAQGAMVPSNVISPTQVSIVKISHVKLPTDNQQQIKITLWFNQKINFSTLTNEQVLIAQYQGEQLTALASNNISFNIINDHTLTINLATSITTSSALTAQSNSPQKFNLQLNNPSISTITSISGQILDGNNDGINGGVFSYDFSL